jgi:membrane protein YqaA with SNARE-associated domain
MLYNTNMKHQKALKKVMNKGKEALNKTLNKTVDRVKNRVKKTHSALKQRVGLGFWILIILIFILGTIYFATLESEISKFIEIYGIPGMFFLSFIVDSLVQPIGPDIILIFGVFSKINPLIVLISVLLGSYLSLFVTYHIGKHIGGAGIEKIVGSKTYKKIENSPHYGKWILFLGSISPIPYIPYLAGMWKLSAKETISIVLIPRTIRFLIVWGLAYFLGTNIMDWF